MHGQWPSHYYSIGMCSHCWCWLTGYTQAIVTYYSQQIFIIIILNGPLLGFPVSEFNDIKGANSPGLLFFFLLSSVELTSTVSSCFLLLLIFLQLPSNQHFLYTLLLFFIFFFFINILFLKKSFVSPQLLGRNLKKWHFASRLWITLVLAMISTPREVSNNKILVVSFSMLIYISYVLWCIF